MAPGEIGEGVGDAGEEFDLMLRDGGGEGDDAVVLLRGDGGRLRVPRSSG